MHLIRNLESNNNNFRKYYEYYENIFSLPVSNPSTIMIIEGFSRIIAPIGPVKSAKRMPTTLSLTSLLIYVLSSFLQARQLYYDYESS